MTSEKSLDEDDNVGSEKEQDAMDGVESSAEIPTYKIPEPSLDETIELLREAIKLNTACFMLYKFSKSSGRPSFI